MYLVLRLKSFPDSTSLVVLVEETSLRGRKRRTNLKVRPEVWPETLTEVGPLLFAYLYLPGERCCPSETRYLVVPALNHSLNLRGAVSSSPAGDLAESGTVKLYCSSL